MRVFDEARERLLRQGLMDAERTSDRLQQQVDQLIASNRDLSGLLLAAERRRGELMKLIVAFRRLVDASDAVAAIRAVEEILVTVVGTEDFVVLAQAGRDTLEAVGGMGPVFDHARSTPPRLDEVIAHPSARLTPASQWYRSDVAACLPLRITEHVVGAIVIAALLPHREPLGLQDDQVLCLLGGFAAQSIVVAEERQRWTQLVVPAIA